MKRERFPVLTPAQLEVHKQAEKAWRAAVCRRAWSFTQPDGKEYPE